MKRSLAIAIRCVVDQGKRVLLSGPGRHLAHFGKSAKVQRPNRNNRLSTPNPASILAIEYFSGRAAYATPASIMSRLTINPATSIDDDDSAISPKTVPGGSFSQSPNNS